MARKRQQAPPRRTGRTGLLVRILGVGVVAVLAVAAVVLLGRPSEKTFPPVTPQPPPFASGTSKGLPTAPVTVVEYSDFQCPYCARFAREVEPDLDADYIATSQVRFIYKHYVILGPESQWAAEASECAAEQNAFWGYKDTLFANQAGEGQGAFKREKLEAFARDLGLDMGNFKKCLDSGKYAGKVEQDSLEARSRGYRGTPTFVIGDQVIPGLPPYYQLQQVIASQLQKTGQ